MTDISLSTYIKVARESSRGVIRESSEDGRKLVNKGTLGHWIATQLNWGDSGTRERRNEEALKGFRQALVDRYGVEVAEQALKAAKLDGDVKTLTGNDVLKAAKHAQRALLENRSGNDEEFLRRRTVGEGQLDSEVQKLVFRQCYRQEFSSRTEHGRVKVEEIPDGLEQGIIDRLKTMSERELTRSLELRRELGEAMVSLLQTVGERRRTRPLLEGMAQIDARLRELAEIERVPPEQVDQWRRAMRDYLMHAAVNSIGRTDVGLLEGVQLKLLTDDAPLRAVYAEAEALSREGTEAEQALARQVMALCESMVNGLSRRLGPSLSLARLDLERLKDGSTVSEGARRGIKTWLTGYSSSVEVNAKVRDGQVGRESTVEGLPPKEPPIKVESVEQVDRKVEQDKALLRARDQWVELISRVKPEPEDLPELDDDESLDPEAFDDRQKAEEDRRWAVILRDRSLKATLDKPALQYMLDTGRSLTQTMDDFHELLLQDETLRDLVGFLDEQTLIDGMVEIEQTGILKEGTRRTELSGMEERRQKFELDRQQRLQVELPVDVPNRPEFDMNACYEFFSDLAGDVPGIGRDRTESEWDGDRVGLQRTVARRIGDLALRLGIDVDTLCNAMRSVLAQADMLPAAKLAVEAGLDLVQRPTPGARLVDDLVDRFPILDGRNGDWLLDDMWPVIAQHVEQLVAKGEMSRDMICEDLAATVRSGAHRHELDSGALDDILYVLGQLAL